MIFVFYQIMQQRLDRLESVHPTAFTFRLSAPPPAAGNLTSTDEDRERLLSEDSSEEETEGRLVQAPRLVNDNKNIDICPHRCRCRCHDFNTLQTPSCLRSITGLLFIGYNAMPWQSRTCNEPRCTKTLSSTTLLYTFPPWLMQAVMVCSISQSLMRGPELSLRMMNVRNPSWTFQGLVKCRDKMAVLAEVKRQLQVGDLSVLDVTRHGATALHARTTFSVVDVG